MKEIKIGQTKRVQGYLLGRSWYSTDHTDDPNHYEFPKRFVTDEAEARHWLTVESLSDKDWDYGSDKAYIAPVYTDGSIGDRIYAN